MASSNCTKTLVVILIFGMLVQTNEAGWWRGVKKTWCRVKTGAVCAAAGVGGAVVAGPVGAGVGYVGCYAIAKECRRRRRDATSDDEGDGKVFVPFPQSFEDYTSGDSVDFETFVAGIENGMPLPLHHFIVVGDAFDKADLNDDAKLDRDEFAKGSWILQKDDESG